MTTSLHLSQFDDESLSKEYREAVKAAGQTIDGWVVIETARLNALKRQYGRPLPPIATQLDNAVAALGRVVDVLITGHPALADDATIAARQQICQACLHLQATRCTQCGCYYPAKIRLVTEHCPLERW